MHSQNIPMHGKAFEIHLSRTFAHLLPEIRPAKSDIVIFLEDRTGSAMDFLMVPKWHWHLPFYEADTAIYSFMKLELCFVHDNHSKTLQLLHKSNYAGSTYDRISKLYCKAPPCLFFFLRISSTLKTGMIKRETKAKKNIQNPLCFCGVPNIFIKVITKASLLHQNKMCSYLKK